MTETATATSGLADLPREQLLRTAEEESIEARDALEQLDQAAVDASLAEVAARATEALAGELRALRYILAAAIAPHEPTDNPDGNWCRIELFGHTVRCGHVREVTRFGRRFLELTQPELTVHTGTDNERVLPAHVKLYSPSAVYAYNEISERAALTAIRHQHGIYLNDDDEEIPF